jgi:hypothetical protein
LDGKSSPATAATGSRPDALAVVAALGFDAAIDPAPGVGWLSVDGLAAGGSRTDEAMAAAGARLGLAEVSARTAGWWVADVAAALAWPAAAVLLVEGRVLVGSGADVVLATPAVGRRLAARFRHTGRPVTDADAVPAFVAGLTSAMTPVVMAAHARTRRGRHALWGTVTDMLVSALDQVGAAVDKQPRARLLADQAVRVPSPLVGATNWATRVTADGPRQLRVRNICCLWYRAPEGGVCVTCPRVAS